LNRQRPFFQSFYYCNVSAPGSFHLFNGIRTRFFVVFDPYLKEGERFWTDENPAAYRDGIYINTV